MYEWMDYAMCREVDQELFFPDTTAHIREAKSICNRCEVQIECLDYALKNHVSGIWGGTTERDRRKLRRKVA